MKKIRLIIQREYLSRVKKKSFIIMTILGPVLMASIWIVPFFLATMSDEKKVVSVVDETGIFVDKFESTDKVFFVYEADLEKAKEDLPKEKYSAVLYVYKPSNSIPDHAVMYYSDKSPGIVTQSYISNAMQTILKNNLLISAHNISKEDYDLINRTNIKLNTEDIRTGKKSYTEIKTALGIFSGILIYFFIFMYGAQVMRGVIEEKTSRIVEVIVSSVKPFQLMMGKIVGIALVGLTQFLLWILLTFFIITSLQIAKPDVFKTPKTEQAFDAGQKIPSADQFQLQKLQNQEFKELIAGLFDINYGLMIIQFLFYFLAGYLLYASLFASIGAAVDSEADTQQFMLPITIPLLFAIIMSNFVINNPDGPVAFWLSIIPLTSPIIMMVRIPFGVPVEQVYLSMGLLILGFIATTWFAGKIYRTGILMYGKKASYRELWKWLKY
ncbi:MAG: ABC transporter permease [Bacteroidetes bacterium]|nr:ABC transporter permease [Bacteroidota bacterium]